MKEVPIATIDSKFVYSLSSKFDSSSGIIHAIEFTNKIFKSSFDIIPWMFKERSLIVKYKEYLTEYKSSKCSSMLI